MKLDMRADVCLGSQGDGGGGRGRELDVRMGGCILLLQLQHLLRDLPLCLFFLP